MLFSTVSSGSRWKFSAVCGAGVCYIRDGRGGAATQRRPAAGWDKHQGILLCSWCSWKKHVGCPHCCPNHGIVAQRRDSDLVLLGLLLLLCSFLFCGYLLRLLIGEKVSSQILQSCKYLQVSTILPPSRCCLTRWYREISKVRKISKGVRTDAATVCSHGFFMSRPPWCSPCNPAVGQPCSFCCPAPDSSSEPSQSPTGTAVMYEILQRAPPCLCFIPSRSSAQFFFLSMCFLLTFSKPF